MEENNKNQINLSRVSYIELKAFAYDELEKIEIAQANLRLINQEIAARAKSAAGASNNAINNSDLSLVK